MRHRNQFSMHGSLQLAFTDSVDARQQSISYVVVRASVVQCSVLRQTALLAKKREHCRQYLSIGRSFDDTPTHVSFGYLAEVLTPAARYVLPNGIREAGGTAVVDHAELLQLGVPPAQHGILASMATTLVVEFAEGDHAEVLVPPRIMYGKKV